MNVAGAVAVGLLVAALWVFLAASIPGWLRELDEQDDYQ